VFVTGTANGTCTTIAYDAATGTQLWLSQPINSSCVALAVSSDGTRVYATGTQSGDDGRNRWHTVSLDAATGVEVWTVQHVSPGLISYATAIALTPDGATVVVTGYDSGAGVTVAYSTADGTPLWTSSYEGGAANANNAVAMSNDGTTVVVTGSTEATLDQPSDYNTVAYNTLTGTQVWDEQYDGAAGSDTAHAIGISVDGGTVFVTGDSAGLTSSSDYATVAYDVSTGTQRWVSRYNGPGNGDDIANALAISPLGSLLYITGQSTAVNGKFDYATLALNANTGNQAWLLRYDGPAHGTDMAVAIAVSPSGQSLFVTGTSKGVGTSADFATQGRIS